MKTTIIMPNGNGGNLLRTELDMSSNPFSVLSMMNYYELYDKALAYIFENCQHVDENHKHLLVADFPQVQSMSIGDVVLFEEEDLQFHYICDIHGWRWADKEFVASWIDLESKDRSMGIAWVLENLATEWEDTFARKKDIIIVVEGGLIQDISNIPEGVNIIVKDFDTDGQNAHIIDKHGDECIVSEY